MTINDIEEGWIFQYATGETYREYGIRTRETFFNLSGTAIAEAGGIADREAAPVCHIRDLTKHLPDLLGD